MVALVTVAEKIIKEEPMSNANHEGQTKVMVWVDDNLVKDLDKMLSEYGYNSRSEYLRSQIIVDVQDYKKSKK